MPDKYREKRLSARIKGVFNISIVNNDKHIQVNTIDLSSSGIQFKSSTNIPLFREISFSMELPEIKGEDSHIFSSNAIVVRSEKCQIVEGYNIALTFIDISEEDKKNLISFLEKTEESVQTHS